MDLKFGDIQETALIPLAIKASETSRPNARIKDLKAKQTALCAGEDQWSASRPPCVWGMISVQQADRSMRVGRSVVSKQTALCVGNDQWSASRPPCVWGRSMVSKQTALCVGKNSGQQADRPVCGE